MRIQRSSRQGCVVLTLAGRLDVAAAPEVQRAILKQLAEQPPAIICDLGRSSRAGSTRADAEREAEMTKTLVDRQPTDYQELAKRVRSHPFVDGPTRKLVRSWDPT